MMDSESEDELQAVYGQDDTPRKRVSTPSIILTAAVGDYGEDEEEEEAVEQVRYVDLDEDEVMGYPAEEDDEDAVRVPSIRSRLRRRRVVVDEDDDMDGNWVDQGEEQDALTQEPEPGDYQVNLNDSPNSFGDKKQRKQKMVKTQKRKRRERPSTWTRPKNSPPSNTNPQTNNTSSSVKSWTLPKPSPTSQATTNSSTV